LVFVTLEDETGFSNAVVMPDVLALCRRTLLAAQALVISGRVQNRDGVVTVRATDMTSLEAAPIAGDVSHDFR
jgi:error-prone DNA polymerase